MSPKSYDNLNCSVARTMEQIGERWTILILRDAFYGVRRFDDFQASLGVARNILTTRLNHLVDGGIMRKEQYQDNPPRHEYRLTEKGRDLIPVITTMLAWGNRWESERDPIDLIHTDCGHSIHAVAVCSECAEPISAHNLTIDPIPRIVRERVVDTRSLNANR
jgi:DNA-binding HxlR family transcriptional regulator